MSENTKKSMADFMAPKMRTKWYVDNDELFSQVIDETIENDYPILYVAEYLVEQGCPFALKTIQKHVKEEITRRLSK